MRTPCENCGSDFRVCMSCDLYNGKYIEIPDNATNGDLIRAFYPDLVVGSNNLGKTIFLRPNATVVIEDRMSDWWNAPYQKGGKE